VTDPELVSSRLLAFPREAVYRAFVEAGLLARWWGPEGFANTFHAFDPRPGGAWRFTMRGPDGTEYAMEKEFVEVVPPARIVLRHLDPVHGFRMEMDLGEEGGGTRLTWRVRFDSAEEAARVREPFLAANEQNFDRLEALLGATR